MIEEVFSCFCLFLTLGWDLWKLHGGNLKFYNVNTNWCDWFSKVQRDWQKKKRKKWCKWEREKRGKKYASYHFLLWMSPLNSVFFYQTRWETFRHTLNVNRAASLWFTDHKDNLLGQSSCPRHGVPADGLNIVLFSFIKLSGEPYGIR